MKIQHKWFVTLTMATAVSYSSSVWSMGKTDDPWLSKTMGEIELLQEGEADVAEWEVDTLSLIHI